jgi:hypothetical protein
MTGGEIKMTIDEKIAKIDQREIARCLLRFSVDPAESQMRLDFGRYRCEAGGHLAARPAPSSPEIDQKWNITQRSVLLKIRRGQLDGLPQEQRSSATARRSENPSGKPI